MDNAHRSFPTSSFRKEHQPRLRSRWGNLNNGRSRTAALIPYLGLVQSCMQIRKEFRPWWMQTHQIPLCNIAKYLRTFFQARPKSDTAYYLSEGRLRIYLIGDELEGRDVLPLIKHILQFPNRTITLRPGVTVNEKLAMHLDILLQNRNPEWIRWVRGNRISQVRLTRNYSNPLNFDVILVVKEQHAAAWMKPSTLTREMKTERAVFLASIGLDKISPQNDRIGYAIDYR
ncbi:hypothetical protein BU23DRAFT_562761 [Bimuria novae-zelandiae CBS 107.79]|uniref:Uncharacterized protein n=1 Tax=Bimuria novae-zelandiae CBS 107.79 TaxID=1447943 RepID=A0A6A5VT21_9PLEO|nr:hypothetical protein BU23DRAFT_562761 [Bimuria novae-zelandiae CBS 107.79]